MTESPSRLLRLGKALGLEHPVLGLWYEDSVPDSAATCVEGTSKTAIWGCAMFLISTAFRGSAVAFTSRTCRCPGGSIGLGVETNPEELFPGGREAMLRFLSCGNRCSPEGLAEAERMRAEGVRGSAVREYLDGEGLRKSPGLAAELLDAVADGPAGNVAVLRPLVCEDLAHPPLVSVMLADSLQLSALVALANYARPGLDAVRVPMATGCASIAAIPLHECRQESPRAVVGLTDITSRRAMQKLLRRDLLSVSVPWSLYREMEDNAGESFLSRPYWKTMNGGDLR